MWDFPRGSWQYDIIVIAILAFIFVPSREVFRDQPRPSSIVMLPAEQGSNVWWMEPQLLDSQAEAAQPARAADLLRQRTGRKHAVSSVRPVFDGEHDLRGFLVYGRVE